MNRTQSLHRMKIEDGAGCVTEKIRCYPAYRTEDDHVVWREENTGEQFFRIKVQKKYYFISVFGGKDGKI